jgi:hypothetical protein
MPISFSVDELQRGDVAGEGLDVRQAVTAEADVLKAQNAEVREERGLPFRWNCDSMVILNDPRKATRDPEIFEIRKAEDVGECMETSNAHIGMAVEKFCAETNGEGSDFGAPGHEVDRRLCRI